MKTYTPAAKALFAKNAASLNRMAEKAAATGRKVNGYTQCELEKMADEALARSKQGDIGVPVRTPIGMSDFFALERVKDLQRTQRQNPYGSKMHRWASEEMRRLADQYCDDKGQSCLTYFGGY